MAEKAYIVEAVRTAGGKRDGRLSLWHPADLGAKILDEVVIRLDMDPALVDDVILVVLIKLVLSQVILPEMQFYHLLFRNQFLELQLIGNAALLNKQYILLYKLSCLALKT